MLISIVPYLVEITDMEDDAKVPKTEDFTPEEANRRLDDWEGRVKKLFSVIKQWAEKEGWNVEPGPVSPVTDVPIVHPAVRPRKQETLQLKHANQTIWVRPKGPWVIGANGRVDLISPHRSAMLIDTAAKYHSPRWRLYFFPKPVQNKNDIYSPPELRGKSFSPEMLNELSQ